MRTLMMIAYTGLAAIWTSAVTVQALRHGWRSPYFGLLLGLMVVMPVTKLALKVVRSPFP